MIHTNRIVTVGEQECIIDRPIVLYRGDREVEVEFTLVGNEFMFSEEGNVIKSVNASHGQLVLNTPSGEHMFSELAECHEGKVVFVVTKEMIDEFIEMGFYSFQIRLYDSAEMKSRVTIPPVMNGFDIRNPIAAEDETNVVDQGIVDYARIFKDQSNEELPTFDWTGAYNKTEWEHHDVITENKLNKIEDALYSINANIKESDVVMLNTLDQVKKDADKYVKEHMAEVEADVDEFERNLNTDVQKFKVNTNAAMTAHRNEVSEELAHIENNITITPDDFEGTDAEKIQQALDYAFENSIKNIQLNRVYNLTGATIYYNFGHNQPPFITGGGLKKEDEGFMFTTQGGNYESDSPIFSDVTFRGDSKSICYIIDGNKMIRPNFQKCDFRYICLIKSDGYLQSLRLDNCEMSYSTDTFIDCARTYDINITNNRFETNNKSLIKCYSDSTSTFACNAMRITNNLIEGYIKNTPIILSSAYGLIIANNYFEQNNIDVEFIATNGINIINGSINNNSFFNCQGNCHIKANGNNVGELYLNNNSTNIRNIDDEYSFTKGLIYENIQNTYSSSGGRIIEKGSVYKSDGVKYSIIDNDGMSAIRITPYTNASSDKSGMIGRNYLVQFSGTFGSSVNYRATFIGILCVGGNWDADNNQTCRELTLSRLASTSMNGANGSNGSWNDSYVSVTFEQTGTNKISSKTVSDIIITFNNIPYNSSYTKGYVKNLQCLLTDSLGMEKRIQE